MAQKNKAVSFYRFSGIYVFRNDYPYYTRKDETLNIDVDTVSQLDKTKLLISVHLVSGEFIKGKCSIADDPNTIIVETEDTVISIPIWTIKRYKMHLPTTWDVS